MQYRNNDPVTPERPSGFGRFTIIIAILQLIGCLSIAWLAMESNSRQGKDSWIAFYILIPAAFLNLTAPLSLISGTYYFIRYRKDDIEFKLIVGLACVSSVLYLAYFQIR